MGEVIQEPVSAISVKIEVEDPDAGDAIRKVDLFVDGAVAWTEDHNGPAFRVATDLALAPGGHHLFVKVTQADDQKLWSAPVWVTVKD